MKACTCKFFEIGTVARDIQGVSYQRNESCPMHGVTAAERDARRELKRKLNAEDAAYWKARRS